MTDLSHLHELERNYQRLRAETEDARAARNDALVAARDAGATIDAMAEATGLSRGRVHQIILNTRLRRGSR